MTIFENGTRFGANEGIDPQNYWDGPDRPNRWYGAGTAILTTGDSIEFDIVNEAVNAAAESAGQFWFAFNSKVATAKVAEKPAEPKAPEKPQQKLTNNTTEKSQSQFHQLHLSLQSILTLRLVKNFIRKKKELSLNVLLMATSL